MQYAYVTITYMMVIKLLVEFTSQKHLNRKLAQKVPTYEIRLYLSLLSEIQLTSIGIRIICRQKYS